MVCDPEAVLGGQVTTFQKAKSMLGQHYLVIKQYLGPTGLDATSVFPKELVEV